MGYGPSAAWSRFKQEFCFNQIRRKGIRPCSRPSLFRTESQLFSYTIELQFLNPIECWLRKLAEMSDNAHLHMYRSHSKSRIKFMMTSFFCRKFLNFVECWLRKCHWYMYQCHIDDRNNFWWCLASIWLSAWSVLGHVKTTYGPSHPRKKSSTRNHSNSDLALNFKVCMVRLILGLCLLLRQAVISGTDEHGQKVEQSAAKQGSIHKPLWIRYPFNFVTCRICWTFLTITLSVPRMRSIKNRYR